jgi:hypothetical protein
LPKFHRAIAYDLRGYLFEKGRFVGHARAVLLIHRDRLARRTHHTAGKSAKVAILRHFRVIDEALAPNPAEQDLLLLFVRVSTNPISIQHHAITLLQGFSFSLYH